MKRNIFYICLLSIFIFTGCVSSTPTLKPKYNNVEKSVNIGNIKLDKVTYYSKKENRPANNLRFANGIKWYYERINLDNAYCNKLHIKVSESRMDKYYIYSCKDDILRHYNNNCNVEKISDTNIYVGKCMNLKKQTVDGIEKTISKDVYGICQSEPKRSGYGTKVQIGLYGNEKCFNYIKDKLKKLKGR
ncbi:hypothetical protein [Arcobacter roscoffensis]|uniref:Lipoprotein n=1 Tax=Arcobacter roscoffensis TaxID=2961520 RepID=A0ABY5E6I4_9BACT|nr:hypothetical protein [Arcobacter roscoffensis]UTJ06648.1 hypothetical protein NJU99_00735 [Arcobacter roscoffensis]